ncbi:MAG: site-2 protease family protein [Cyclobacteriaceae bacterium]|nr:site-2 protease family protein [Flammeovirgaceae bacterium]
MNPRVKQVVIHIGLFAATFVTTTLAGAEWVYSRSVFDPTFSWHDFASGLPYSVAFLSILTVHEFGHYFTALYYRVRVTLPYYIPLPPGFMLFGTLGALIRLKERVRSTKVNFDIGIAGPLAGFILAVGILAYGFTHLPPAEYVFQFHPDYEKYGLEYANHVYPPAPMPPGVIDIKLGKSLLYSWMERLADDPRAVPNPHEIIHYPLLFAGYLALVFTSINLLPIGQLDGGHVLYGLIGHRRHRLVASIIFGLFIFYAGLGYINPASPGDQLFWEIPLFIGFLYLCFTGLRLHWQNTLMIALAVFTAQYVLATVFPGIKGYSGWLFFGLLLGRFVGVPHPPAEVEEKLSLGRQILGWLALVILLITFVPNPIEIFEALPPTDGAP